MAIGTVEFDLSLTNPDTGEYLTARTYTVPGVNNVDGTPRELSMGELVMAICLQRATALEAAIVQIMDELNKTSAKLESLTEINQAVVDYFSSDDHTHVFQFHNSGGSDNFTNLVVQSGLYAGQTYRDAIQGTGIVPNTQNVCYVRDDAIYSAADILDTDIEDKMDELNSLSQQTMIELQSQTSKRDQTYDMISNILKSLNTVQVGIVNNY